jgi:hypothetical protein
MEGMLPAYLDAVLWQPDILSYGATGDVVTISGTTLTLSEPVPDTTTRIALMRSDGTVWGPTTCTVLAANQVQVSTAPDFVVLTAGAGRERTKFVAGTTAAVDTAAETVRIAAISDGGKRDGVQYWRIDAAIDDDRVHSADVALLPGEGVTQDPIDDGTISGGGGGGGSGIIIDLRNAEYVDIQDNLIAQASILLELRNNGRLFTTNGAAIVTEFAGQWTPAQPIAGTTADDYEVRVSLISGDALTAGTLDTWLNLGTTRSWERSQSVLGSSSSLLKFEIRDAAGVIQDTADIRLSSTLVPHDPI